MIQGDYSEENTSDYFEDYKFVLENYLGKSFGNEKTSILLEWLAEKEADHLNYFVSKSLY
jgi:hypothetical protein